MSARSEVAAAFDPADLATLDQESVQLPGDGVTSASRQIVGWLVHVRKLAADLGRSRADRGVWNEHDLVAALEIRDRVEEALAQLDRPLRKRARAFVDRIDQEYQSFTRDDDQRILGRVLGADLVARSSWWWSRIPASGPIAEDLAQPWYHDDRTS
jgi:hypothetical protein